MKEIISDKNNSIYVFENWFSKKDLMQLKKIAHKVDVNSKKYDIELYDNKSYINKLSNIVGEKLYKCDSNDWHTSWFRKYNCTDLINPFENWHYDKNRYCGGVKQYRFVHIIEDTTENSTFSYYDKKEKIKKHINSKENMLIIIEADKLYHKVDILGSHNQYRTCLMFDYITSKNKERSIIGKINFLHDTIWININKYIIGTINKRDKIV